MKDWIVMPTLDAVDYTEQAVRDCLAQTGVDVGVLVVNNGGTNETRARLDRLQLSDARVLVWHHDPPLPSLSATWNRMLDFVWSVGGEHALVVNNDVRLDHWTYQILWNRLKVDKALFVSAVGWNEQRWMAEERTLRSNDFDSKGGPDFSCFLLSREAHQKYPFDEGFVPAYCEDLDCHRRYMLGGDGHRIFSVNLPYLHFASRTVNQSEEHRRKLIARIEAGSREHYRRKWGGDVNQETYRIPFEEMGGSFDVTTPELQRMVLAGETFPWERVDEELEAETLGDA